MCNYSDRLACTEGSRTRSHITFPVMASFCRQSLCHRQATKPAKRSGLAATLFQCDSFSLSTLCSYMSVCRYARFAPLTSTISVLLMAERLDCLAKLNPDVG
jgi:hypothetical protein